MGERVERPGAPAPVVEAARGVERRPARRRTGRRRHDGHVGVVLGRRPDHRRPADVDLLDQLVDRDARAARARPRTGTGSRRRARTGAMPRVEELEPVVLEAAIGQEAGVDARMERLDPPVEHLRRPGHGGHVGHRQARVAQGPRRATGRHELEAARDEPATERRPARSCPRPTAARGAGSGRARRPGARSSATRRPSASTVRAPARSRATTCGSSRCSTARIRSWRRRGVVAGQDRHGLLGDDRPAVEGRVDEVDGAAGDPHARGERVLDRVRARERRQERRMRVDDPAVERGQDGRPDDPHVAGEDDRVDPDRGERSPRASRRRRRGRARSRSPAPPPSRAPGSRDRRRRGRISPPSSPRSAAAASARRFEPAPETPTATRPEPFTPGSPGVPRRSAAADESPRRRPRRRRPPGCRPPRTPRSRSRPRPAAARRPCRDRR